MKYLKLIESLALFLIFYLSFYVDLSHQENTLADTKIYEAKRLMHKQAIESILKYSSRVKQYDLVSIMLKKIVQILKINQELLVKNAVLAGDNIPVDKEMHEAYLVSIENSALFCDISLHFPDLVHSFIKKTPDLILLINWSISFTVNSPMLPNHEQKLFNLASQELGLIERDRDYINPYKKGNEDIPASSHRKELKKSKVRKQKGPKLSKIEL